MLFLTAGCMSTRAVTCLPGEQSTVTESLYFGTAKRDGVVTPNEWIVFIDETVTPAFPEGFTSWPASGQWRKAAGPIEKETSHILQLTHDGSTERETAIRRIMAKYKNDFQQEAVMRIRAQACRSF